MTPQGEPDGLREASFAFMVRALTGDRTTDSAIRYADNLAAAIRAEIDARLRAAPSPSDGPGSDVEVTPTLRRQAPATGQEMESGPAPSGERGAPPLVPRPRVSEKAVAAARIMYSRHFGSSDGGMPHALRAAYTADAVVPRRDVLSRATVAAALREIEALRSADHPHDCGWLGAIKSIRIRLGIPPEEGKE